jgi:hypothetical protein
MYILHLFQPTFLIDRGVRTKNAAPTGRKPAASQH